MRRGNRIATHMSPATHMSSLRAAECRVLLAAPVATSNAAHTLEIAGGTLSTPLASTAGVAPSRNRDDNYSRSLYDWPPMSPSMRIDGPIEAWWDAATAAHAKLVSVDANRRPH
jgi:hypothetical protein